MNEDLKWEVLCVVSWTVKGWLWWRRRVDRAKVAGVGIKDAISEEQSAWKYR